MVVDRACLAGRWGIAGDGAGDEHDQAGRLQAPRARAHGQDGRVLHRGARAAARAAPGAGTLHVTNGDSTGAVAAADRARRARRRVARRAARGPGARRRRRGAARRAGAASSARRVARASRQRDAALAAGRDGEYVLWFEADLYDQLQIAQILARLAELRVPAERITLICIGEYLGIAHFGGLGELRPDQLEGLPAAAAVTLDRRRARASPRARGRRCARPTRADWRRSWRRARPSCASCPRPSTASAASTRGRATASRSPSAACSPRSPRAPATAGEAFVRAAAPRGAPVPRRHVGLRGDRAPGARRGAAARGGAGAVDRARRVALTEAGRRRARRRRGPRRAQRDRSLDRRRAPRGPRGARGGGTTGSRRSWLPPALEALRGANCSIEGRE